MDRPLVMHQQAVVIAVLALTTCLGSLPAMAQVLDYVCEGVVRTDNVFDAQAVTAERQRFRVTANVVAGYVKRDPGLATGCFAGRTEVCACEPPSVNLILCRSLGFRADGTEVSLDFILRPADSKLQLSGKQFNGRSGTLVETSGSLDCVPATERANPAH